jgi:hypothetical protein
MTADAVQRRRSGAVRAVAPFAIALALASLLGRAFAPSAVGTVAWADALLIVDGVVAQLVAVATTALCGALLVAASTAPRPAWLRAAMVALGALSILVGLSAAGASRIPAPALVTVAVASSAAAILGAIVGARRLPELALGLAGVGGLIRLAAVHLADGSTVASSTVATVGLAVELALIAVAAAFTLRAPRRGAIAVGLAVLAAAGAAWVVVSQPDARLLVVTRIAIERLAPRPHPFGAGALPAAIAVLALVLAVGLCVARRADRSIVGGLALVLVVRSQGDVPLLGMALAAAALTLFLAWEPSPAAAPRGTSPHPAATDRIASDEAVG